MNPIWKAAREYAERGWSVIPAKPDKSPIGDWKKYQTEIASPHQIDSWFRVLGRCVAIVCGRVSGIVVVDIENPSLHLYRDLPETLCCMSQGSGAHWYYRYPEGVDLIRVIASGQKDGDLRSNGQYVIAPPSRGTKGGYVWLNHAEPVSCPERFARRVSVARPVPPTLQLSPLKVSTALPYRDAYPSRSERIMAIVRAVKISGGNADDAKAAVMDDWSGSKLEEKGDLADRYIQDQFDFCNGGVYEAGIETWATIKSVRRMVKTCKGDRLSLLLVTDSGIEIHQGITLIAGTVRTEAFMAAAPVVSPGVRLLVEIHQVDWNGNSTWKVKRFLKKQ